MQNFFDQFDSAPAPKGPILGPAPIPKTPDPYQVQKDERSAAMEAERLRLSQESAAREAAKFGREEKKFAATGGVDATESERTAAFLATRVADSVAQLQKYKDSRPSLGVEATRKIGGDVPANYLTEENRQIVETNQLDLLDAALTLGTGAAYTKEQLEGYRKTYFPQLGDGPDTIREKNRKLSVILQAARVKAGAAAPLIDRALQSLDERGGSRIQGAVDTALSAFSTASDATVPGSPESQRAAALGRSAQVNPDDIVFGMDLPGSQTSEVTAGRLNAQQQAALDAFLRANAGNPNFGQEQLSGFYRSMGLPEGAAPGDEAFFEAVRKGEDFGTQPDYTQEDERRRALVEQEARERYGDDPSSRASLLLKGASLNLSDEIAGVGGAIYDTLTGGSPAEGYRRERDIERIVQGESRDKYGLGYEIAGSLATPLGALKRPATVGEFASQGAKLGAVAGFGEGEGVGGSAINALGGAGLGYVAGGAIGKGANVVRGRAAQKAARQAERAALQSDFAQEGVRALPANVGGSGVNRITAGMAQSPIASDTIRSAAQEQAAGFGSALQRRAGEVGDIKNIDDAGAAFREAGKRGIARNASRIGNIYQTAEREAAGVRIAPAQAIRQIDDEIARLSEAKDIQQPLISELQKLKGTLTQSPEMSVEGLKLARSFAGKASSTDALRNTDAKATLKRVYGALADDFDGGLRRAGKDKAARLFRKADALWSARIDDIDGAWEPVIGKGKSGEAIVETIESMARGKSGGFARLKTVMSGMTPDERADMTATIIDRMGRATPGRQGAAGDTYSADTFLTNWNRMSDKSKGLLFNNQATRESMDRLARIAESVKESGRFANASNTSGGFAAQLLAGGVGYAIGDITGLAVPAATTYLTGRLMASPRFVNWLAKAPRNMTPEASRNYAGRLRGIAAAEPAIAGDISRFSQFLNAANDASPARAAAQGQEEGN